MEDKVVKIFKCRKCSDTGVMETGNNDLACDCKMGDAALFNHGDKLVCGAELNRHFYNHSNDPLDSTFNVEELPGRTTDLEKLKLLMSKLPKKVNDENLADYYKTISDLQELTTKMLGLKD